ncbi:TIGR03620 family F420-dependent LLM class oxidoreductase [Nocardia sp. NPDC020380]|uniref:TIGR03620 family F420-dependent LLM class oxidoreductase n=1 Tax=Nocardia sp. NPDC020380 TaxID=3364309 RepID=UPI0037A3E204
MSGIDGMDLGKFGVWTFDFEQQPAALIRESAQELEELGWQALWIPETVVREAFTHAGLLLAATERIHIVNGIAQIASREARRTFGAATLLADAYSDRHVLGLGYGGKRPDVSPLTAMHDYLDELDELGQESTLPPQPIRRILAAYGPKMLELARDRSAGAHTYHVNVAHTAQAREILGPGAFLGVEHAVVFETDPDKAREIARTHLAGYLQSPYNLAKFRRLGYTEADLADGGSDRFVDDLAFWGDLDHIVAKLNEHVEAGADHVGIQVLGTRPGSTAMPYWRLLAEALVSPAGSNTIAESVTAP